MLVGWRQSQQHFECTRWPGATLKLLYLRTLASFIPSLPLARIVTRSRAGLAPHSKEQTEGEQLQIGT